MKRAALASIVVSIGLTWLAVAQKQTPPVQKTTVKGHSFTLPPDFEIELVAASPLVDRPITAAFDDQGRLYVADSSGSNEKVELQLEKKPHRIVRLEDTDGDGKFDKSVVFADKVMFPEGTMWLKGSLYVAAPPSIWKLTDTDGDGVADQRSEWFQGKTLTGCANDLHGPYQGPDGWIYWAKGAFAKQSYEIPGKKPFVTRAAHLFRARPDGTGIEAVMNGGMDNPVDVVFTPGGERIFTTTFFQTPGGGQRDGLIHAIYGGIYGKIHEPIYEHKWTSPQVMPVLAHMGAAAPCGLIRYESSNFGPVYRDNLFACQFNLHKLSRHVLTPDGATFKSVDEDFLVSDNHDFHPTDVLEDADGSILVVDTGGWYKLCCPSSQLVKPDVLGGIYRIRKKNAPKIEDPRGLKIAWEKTTSESLAKLLGDPRPIVRARAMQILADKGALASLRQILRTDPKGWSVEARKNAVWTACRIDSPEARALIRESLNDTDEIVRQVAIHSISVWCDREATKPLIAVLQNSVPHNCRAAAEALGRIGDKTAVRTLLEGLGRSCDRALEHSLIYALIEIGDPELTRAGLASRNIAIRRSTLVALDQMDNGQLEAKSVAAELSSLDARMRETAWWIVGRHPEWSTSLAGALRERMSAKDMKPAEREELISQLAKMARAPAAQEMLGERLRDPAASRESRQTVLRAMAQAGLRWAPESWIGGLIQILAGDDDELRRDAVATIRALRVPKQIEQLAAALRVLGENDKQSAILRLQALAAMPNGIGKVNAKLFDFLRAQLKPTESVATRTTGAEVLGRAKLNTDQLVSLSEVLATAGPLEVDRLLDAFGQSSADRVGLALVKALKSSPARANLQAEALKLRLSKFSPVVLQQAEELFTLLKTDTAKQRERLEQLLAEVKNGDIRRGQAVFKSQKAACAACHAIGYLGGTVGPDLTSIGQIRTERDLLESIVFPSASFVRSYEPVVIGTKDGKSHNGVIRRDLPHEIVLATGVNQEIRIARSEIEEMQASQVSVMPAGLDQQLTPQELADLVAFLKACRGR